MLPVYKRGLRYASFIKRKPKFWLLATVGMLGVCSILVLCYFFHRQVILPSIGIEESDLTNPQNQENQDENNKLTTINMKSSTSQVGIVRMAFPFVAGYAFGFIGSIPVAGPTSAMVLKLGIQGQFNPGQAIAVGGATAEAMYAGIAYWGFGSFLAGAKFLLPMSKVLGAVMLLAVGVYFLQFDAQPQVHKKGQASSSLEDPRYELVRNLLLGMTMSGINPALIATYTGAIATVYGTGLLDFNVYSAIIFSVGVCLGVSSWFTLLLSLLKKYKQRLRTKTLSLIVRCMGFCMILLGLVLAKSAVVFLYSKDTDPPTIET